MIITHRNPDLDAIAGVWLLKRFGGLERDQVKFVNTGNPDEEALAWATAVVDTGREYDPTRRRFDHHHLPGASANETCATAQVFQSLSLENSEISHIKPLIDLVFYGDTGKREAKASRQLGLHAMLAGYKAWFSEQNPQERLSDEACMVFGFKLLDILECRLRKGAEARAELDEKVVYRSNDNLVWGIRHGSQGASFSAFEEGAKLVIFEGQPIRLADGVSYPVGILRAGEMTEPDVGKLAERVAVHNKTFADEISKWFEHPAGFFAGRGTGKAPVFEPVTVDIAALASEIDAMWPRAQKEPAAEIDITSIAEAIDVMYLKVQKAKGDFVKHLGREMGGMSARQITEELNRMFPDKGKDNRDFAETIFNAVNQQ